MAPSKVADRATVNSNTASATHDYALSGLTVGNLLIIRTAADNAGGGGAAVTVTVTNQSGTPIDTSTDLAHQQNCDPGAASAGTTCNVILAEITATSGTVRLTYGASIVQAGVAEEWTGLVAIGSVVVGTPFGAARTTANTSTPALADTPSAIGNLEYGVVAIEGPASDTYTQDADTTEGSWSDLTKAGTSLGTADLNQTTYGGYKVVTGIGVGQSYIATISTARESAALILELAAASGDATANPAVISRSAVLPAPTVTGGISATASPATIARSFTVVTATAGAGASVAPAVIARSIVLPAPNTWDPSDITGLEAWWDATSGTSSQTDGATQLAWNTKASDGGGPYTFLQVTAGARPTYKTNIINGYPVLRFDGTTDFMEADMVSDASRTIFLVAKRGAGGSTTRTVFTLDPDDTQSTNAAVYNTSGAGWSYSNPATPFAASSPDRFDVLTLKYVSTSDLTLYTNGEVQASINPHDDYQSGTQTRLRIGAGTDTTNFFSGDIAEIIIYNSALSDPDRALVETYLIGKYSQWSLIGFMGRWDDGTETGASTITTPFTVADGMPAYATWGDNDRWHPFRARFTIEAGPAAVTVTPKLQYAIPLGGAPHGVIPWTDVDTTTTHVRVYPSDYVTDGTATTNIASEGTGTFVAGTVETSSGTAGAVALGAGQHTEIEYCVVNATSSQGAEVALRVIDTATLGRIEAPADLLNTVVCEDPTYFQDEYRGRNDDGTETTATWKAADNTPWTQVPDTTFRVRFAIRVNQVHPSYRELFRLQRRLNAGAWDYVTTTSSVVKAVTSANFADEDTTTQQLSVAATYLAGRMSEDGVASDDWSFDWAPEQTFVAMNRTELEFALQIVDADTATSDVVELRILNYREAFTVDTGGLYTQTPSITVGAGAVDGTATPAVIARSFTVETAGATGGGTVAPATITRVFLQPAPTVSVGSTLTPATIARSFTQPAPSLSAGSTVTAPLIARDILLPAPAATGGGSATATPAVITGAFTLPAPATSSGSTASPAAIARSVALPAPTVSGGTGATASPAVVARSFLLVAPVVSVGSTLAPATIALSVGVPNPAASGGGSASVAPAVIAQAFTLPAPSLSLGGSATPATIARQFLEPAPTASGGGTATPATIARTIGVPNPSASGASAGTAAPATIARSFTQPAPSLSAGSSTTPATIARSFTLPAASATGGTAATPATIARQFLQPTPNLSYGSTLTVTPIAVAVIVPAPTSTGGGTKTPAVIARQFALPAATATGGGTAFPATIVLFILLPTVGAQGSIYPDLAPFVRAYVLDARRVYRLTGARTYTVNGQRVYRR